MSKDKMNSRKPAGTPKFDAKNRKTANRLLKYMTETYKF